MGWSIGFDSKWDRDIGYGVPAYCDHPKCDEVIDRGLSYVEGCGLYFCGAHQWFAEGFTHQVCERCRDKANPFKPKPDHSEWIQWKLTNAGWQKWREENPAAVSKLTAALSDLPAV